MAKTLIFLFDGTARDASSIKDTTIESFTNVYAINELIAESKFIKNGNIKKEKPQITFYMPGVGTVFTVRRPASGRLSWLFGDRVRQQLFGDGLEQMILRAYVNLCANYTSSDIDDEPSDSIVCIGFSRGAAAARIFSRLISDFGILSSNKLMRLDRAWNEFVEISFEKDDAIYYDRIKLMKEQIASAFPDEDTFHPDHRVSIDFLGLFDTVLGSMDEETIRNMHLRDLYPADKVKNIVHILSMHETRKSFELKRFTQPVGNAVMLREIWMPGVHSDIGGGYIEHLIGSISLLTMTDLLEKYANINIDRKAYDLVVERVRKKYNLGPLVFNKEPSVDINRSRNADIRSVDEIHPLHWHLVGKKVYWKGYELPIDYINRFERNKTLADEFLTKRLDYWINCPNSVAPQSSEQV